MKNVLFGTLALILAAGLALALTTPEAPAALEIGEKAPTFKLKNAIDGKWYSYSPETIAADPEVKGYTVVFTCNTCPIARKYEQRIIEMHEALAPKGYPVVAIQPNYAAYKAGDGESDSPADMKKRALEKEYPFVYLVDEGQALYPQYGATRTPEVFLLDENFVLQYHGAIDDNTNDPSAVTSKFVEEAVAALESGEKPEVTETKAIGCSIKVKRDN